MPSGHHPVAGGYQGIAELIKIPDIERVEPHRPLRRPDRLLDPSEVMEQHSVSAPSVRIGRAQPNGTLQVGAGLTPVEAVFAEEAAAGESVTEVREKL